MFCFTPAVFTTEPLRSQIAEQDRQPAFVAIGVIHLADAIVRIEAELLVRHVADRFRLALDDHALVRPRAAGRDRGQFQRFLDDAAGADVVLVDVLAQRLAA